VICCNHEEEKTFNNALIHTEILVVIGRCSVSHQIVRNIENFRAFWGVCEQADSVEAPEWWKHFQRAGVHIQLIGHLHNRLSRKQCYNKSLTWARWLAAICGHANSAMVVRFMYHMWAVSRWSWCIQTAYGLIANWVQAIKRWVGLVLTVTGVKNRTTCDLLFAYFYMLEPQNFDFWASNKNNNK